VAPQRPVDSADAAEPTLEDAYLSLLNGAPTPTD
jgi:hypothetical protein